MPAGDDGPFTDTVTLEQKTSSIEGTGGKVSVWMQWMLPKVTVQLFAPDPSARKAGMYHSYSSIILKEHTSLFLQIYTFELHLSLLSCYYGNINFHG